MRARAHEWVDTEHVLHLLLGQAGDYRKAVQRIYHAPGQASFIELPLVATP